jgi:hypothetical protein
MMDHRRILGLVLGLLAALTTILLPSSSLAGPDDPFAATFTDLLCPAATGHRRYPGPGPAADPGALWFAGAVRPALRGLLLGLPWLLWLLFTWYTIYSPLTLYLPAGFPDLWPTLGSHALMVVLLAWVTYSPVAAFLPAIPGSSPSRWSVEKDGNPTFSQKGT